MKSKKNNKNSIEITEQEVKEEQIVEPTIEPIHETPKPALSGIRPSAVPKRVLSESQLEALAKARVKAQERKQELKELNAKSKGLKEERLKDDAKEYDKLQKKKELDETVKKLEVPNPPQIEKKKKIKKIIYEDDTDEESVEEVIVKRKKPKEKKERIEPSYEQLANMSVEQQIKNKLQQEKIQCFFNQLTGKKF